MKSKKKQSKAEEAVKAYKPKNGDIPSDVLGSWTGDPLDKSEPVQDADDL